jgi:hypothetical protein
VCPQPPATIDPDTATDKDVGRFINRLSTGYGTCWRHVEAYKTFRKQTGAP